jgi:glucokinase
MVTLGTGIGGAAMVEGKLLRGRHFQAGCLGGHFTINLDGKPCNCGNVGCVEAEASSWSIPERARSDPGFSSSLLASAEVIDYMTLFSLARERDPLAERLVRHSINAWSSGIVNMIHAFDPERVIIGGGIMRSSDQILPHIAEYVKRHAWTPWGTVQIAAAQDMDNAALLGIGYLLQQHDQQT